MRHTAYVIGLLGLALVGASCGGGGGRGSCLNEQYIVVQWEVVQGNQSFSCTTTPPSHVRVLTNANEILDVVADIRDCDDSEQFNWIGSTVAGLAVGTSVVEAYLVDDVTGATLSTAPGPNVGVPSCNYVMYSFQFPIL